MQPDWYPAWRDEAIEQLKAKNARLKKDLHLGSWSRYDYDLTAGTLLFSQDGVVKVVTEIQIVGSTSTEGGNWLWAWANSSLPSELLSDAKLVRSFGEQHGIDELARAYATRADNALEVLGWELSAVMSRICDGLGIYRCPSREDGGGFYLMLKSINWAS
ncbi:hypothetical protein C8D77_10888 [Mesorhizobium loti]|jgi:hypothetical protein|uniref:Uncharacterized protein n=1 Tax=Rhizobium loti TaxID=381 RepID=A0A8E3B2X4_RHILI|nr:DUF6882 domain-containing protein [Mesorhizobium loti]PWJ89143.1 hypothetical protein C8D77_10888 [Mesorhizobium loti]